MNTLARTLRLQRPLVLAAAATGLSLAAWAASSAMNPAVVIGADNNSVQNPFVQPQDPALAGGGRDQTQQFGDVLIGGSEDDVLVGGTEHFNPANRDRAFGGAGEDVFLWSPGDGSDLFMGGPGVDAVVFGLMGEVVNGQLVFQVSTDQQAGEVWINPATGLPNVDVTNSPGFCEVIDASTSAGAAAELDELGLDHLVQFLIRGVANDFANGVQNTDNGLRVTLHLKDVEVLVCTNRTGGTIEAFNLTVSPPQQVPLAWAAARVPALASIVQ